MIDNERLHELYERKLAKTPHLTDCEGREIYSGETYYEIHGEIYSMETLEEHERYFIYDE